MAEERSLSGPGSSESAARHLMEEFAERTGLLSPGAPQVRYLWTDAFAVCSYLTLYLRTGADEYRDLAVRLIDSVHHVLGRYREDDARNGWISGLDETEGERHPTAGGLRIGKPLRERGPNDPYDDRLEWDRDGQYYHYLVKWMHALGRAAAVLGDARYHVWAVELAEASYAGFTYAPRTGGPRRMVWKMSTDLERPLVPSEGAHDPLDGLVASCELRVTASDEVLPRPRLDTQIQELARMCAGRSWVSDDPLGVGGLLMDACWVEALLSPGNEVAGVSAPLRARLWEDASASLSAVVSRYPFGAPVTQRLGFRELGLVIGLRGVAAATEVAGVPDDVIRYLPLADRVLATWLDPRARAHAPWTSHEDINDVMLATALAPDEFLRV